MTPGRQELYNEKYGLIYGVDHLVGKFIKIWTLNPLLEEDDEDLPDENNILVDKNDLNGALSGDDIIRIAEEYGFDIWGEFEEGEVNYDEG